MDINAALGMIDAGLKANANKEAQARESLHNRIKIYEEKVRWLIPKIKELSEVVAKLAENRVNNQFCFTDGIDHLPGFYPGRTIWSAPDYFKYGASRHPSNFFGKAGGGCCGPSLKIDIETGDIYLWGTDRYHNDPMKLNPYDNIDRTRDYLDKLRNLVRQMPDYEKRIEEYISNPNKWVIH